MIIYVSHRLRVQIFSRMIYEQPRFLTIQDDTRRPDNCSKSRLCTCV